MLVETLFGVRLACGNSENQFSHGTPHLNLQVLVETLFSSRSVTWKLRPDFVCARGNSLRCARGNSEKLQKRMVLYQFSTFVFTANVMLVETAVGNAVGLRNSPKIDTRWVEVL